MTAQKSIPNRPVIVLVGDTPRSLMSEEIGNNNQYTEKIFGVKPQFIYVALPNWFMSPEDDTYFLELLKAIDIRPSEIQAWLQADSFSKFIRTSVLDELRKYGLEAEAVRLFGVNELDLYDKTVDVIKQALRNLFPNAGTYNPDLADQPHADNSQYEEMLIEELELGVRPYNCLKRDRVHTVGDLLKKSEKDIRAIPNLGTKGRREIKEALAERQLSLRQE